jgi:hypothetical protein
LPRQRQGLISLEDQLQQAQHQYRNKVVTTLEEASVVEDVVDVDLATDAVDEEVLETARTEADVADDDAVVVMVKRKTGCLSPSSVAWCNLERSEAWRKSTSSVCRSKRQKLLTTS